jgi:chorismate dehydratase
MNKLKVGRINYANLFPIYYTLEKEFDCSSYEFVDGVPSHLNRMLRAGAIDVSPSSSVEYLRNRSLYNILDGVSISSRGPVGSVFLFSRRPIEALSGNMIILTSQSDTAVALLEIILRRFYGLDYSFEVSESPETKGKNTFLMIGDDAIKYNSRVSKLQSYFTEMDGCDAEPVQCLEPATLVHDLGEIWFKKTGLPFVFALWMARKELYDPADPRHEIFNKYIADLKAAKEIALKNLPEIARSSPLKPYLNEDEIIEYWNKLDYELSDDHKKSLSLFTEYLG